MVGVVAGCLATIVNRDLVVGQQVLPCRVEVVVVNDGRSGSHQLVHRESSVVLAIGRWLN